jgi:hypothetical protein
VLAWVKRIGKCANYGNVVDDQCLAHLAALVRAPGLQFRDSHDEAALFELRSQLGLADLGASLRNGGL